MYLRALRPALEASGVNEKIRKDLDDTCGCLQSFGELPIVQFAAFLERAEHYQRTGEVPVVVATAKPARAPAAKKAKAEVVPIETVGEELKAFSERIGQGDESITYDLIDLEVAKLKTRKLAELDMVFAALGMTKQAKGTKDAKLKAIAEKLNSRKKNVQRTAF